jgi:hypothetical protein
MKNFYKICILAITLFIFGDSSFAQDISKKEFTPTRKHKIIEFNSNKRNCDLCVNLQAKKKTVQV